VADGWLIINGEKYREEIQKLFFRARKAELQREYRKRKGKKGGGGPIAGEREFELALENGEVDEDGIPVKPSPIREAFEQ
jgi:hypothetical protein